MSLFDMCCPRKPKKSLDYIIKWIDDADKKIIALDTSIESLNSTIISVDTDLQRAKTELADLIGKNLPGRVSVIEVWADTIKTWKSTIESWEATIDTWKGEIDVWKEEVDTWKADISGTIEEIVDEKIEEYPWSSLPDVALSKKADKVEGAISGNLASLDEYGNLVDSEIEAASVISIERHSDTAYNFYDSNVINSITNEGIHNIVYKGDTSTRDSYYIMYVENYTAKPSPIVGEKFVVEQCVFGKDGVIIRHASFEDEAHTVLYEDWSEWENAIITDTIEQYSQKALTSGAAYDALEGKADAVHTHSSINSGSTSVSIDGSEGTITIEVSNSDSGGETTITPNNIENLDRALQGPETTPISGSNKFITSGGVYEAIHSIPVIVDAKVITVTASGFSSFTLSGSTDIVTYISDITNSARTIVLNSTPGEVFSCLATIVAGESEQDPVSGIDYVNCTISVGSLKYTGQVYLNDTYNTIFTLQS